MWDISELENESDVEHKLIWPLLTQDEPIGFGIPSSAILTKTNIRRFIIEKGKSEKSYFPDYLVVNLGYPILVIEAKSPKESIKEGYRQARLYATELNALHPHGISPTKYILATNGLEIWYGHYDHSEPIGKVECKKLTLYTPGLAELIDNLLWRNLQSHSEGIAKQKNPDAYFKARRLVGGKGRQNEEIQANSFGASVAATISHIFNPETIKDRKSIVENAYIPSQRRDRAIGPIDRVIRAAKPPSEIQAKTFEDSSHPTEILDKLYKQNDLEHKVLLIVGSVGSGKTTFLDHLQHVALPQDIRQTTVWCRLNMNNSPVYKEEIYDWLRKEIIAACRDSLPDIDFDDITTIKKLYGVELAKFKKGVGALYTEGTEIYNTKLGEEIENIQRNQHLNTNAHVRYTCGERGKLCIVALDNCDKKTRDEQLLMFEAAQWIQKEFRCLVIMPLRDETFDNHREQPPLDTALKDMVFRIEPPMFQHVLTQRVKLSLKTFSDNNNDQFSIELSNGIHVDYPRSEQAYYLSSIIKSIFEHHHFAQRMIMGLAGRNIRKALEIFLEFCSSGYISDNDVFKIRQSKGSHMLQFHQVATVIMRINRRYYDSDNSYIRNVFSSHETDPIPTYFARYMILKWLKEKFYVTETPGFKGYQSKSEIKRNLIPFGYTPEAIDREVDYLLAGQCIIAEHLRTDGVDDEDLVRLGPAGFVHLDLTSNINYLAAIAEDTLFDDRTQAERVANRIKTPESHLQKMTAVSNASEVVDQLSRARQTHIDNMALIIKGKNLVELSDISVSQEAVERNKKSHSDDPWFDADKRLQRGSTHSVSVVNITDFGVFVEFEDGLRGLIHNSKLNNSSPGLGAIVEVRINWIDIVQRKMDLFLLTILEEDMGDRILGSTI